MTHQYLGKRFRESPFLSGEGTDATASVDLSNELEIKAGCLFVATAWMTNPGWPFEGWARLSRS